MTRRPAGFRVGDPDRFRRLDSGAGDWWPDDQRGNPAGDRQEADRIRNTPTRSNR